MVWRIRSLRIATACLLVLVGSSAARAEEPSKKVDDQEAMKLVLTALGPPLPGAGLDVTSPEGFAPFLLVQALGNEAFTFGWYAVNPWTGDVWDVWICRLEKRMSTPALRAEQAAIKHRFTAKELAAYPALRKIKPNCLRHDV